MRSFEFENIGKSDTTVMYTDFHGYADGYEVNQSYAPKGTGLDFSVKMSAGRKGTDWLHSKYQMAPRKLKLNSVLICLVPKKLFLSILNKV